MDMMSTMRARSNQPRRRSEVLPPPFRSLRGYAFDPGYSLQLDTALTNNMTFEVKWEEALGRGPVGEYIEVVDYDPASGCFYPPLDLNDPLVIAQDGLPPSESNPQFHQQMVYAVAMTTIWNFEQAMGRAVLWSPRLYRVEPQHTGAKGDSIHAAQGTAFGNEYDEEAENEVEVDGNPDAPGLEGEAASPAPRSSSRLQEEYVQKLRIYPHAVRRANAYYNPEKKALLFGYFPASEKIAGRGLPGGTIFSCLSHDIIAHETTHAILDGLYERFMEPSNPDVLAFHEAFSDIVALFQHFTFPKVLRQQLAKTRGEIRTQNLLGELAGQFGTAIGKYAGLRNAIGRMNDQGEWELLKPDPQELTRTNEAHARGAILVAAVFDAFISIYDSRVSDLLRIATSGSGVLPPGDIHPDLVNRLADEAATAARHVLQMCIRALDYCPPFDITFGEYLQAIISADIDLVPDDDLNYRVAFVEAFRRRGIYPQSVRSLSQDSLRWRQVPKKHQHFFRQLQRLPGIIPTIQSFRTRIQTYNTLKKLRGDLHTFIRNSIIEAALGQSSDDKGHAPQWDIVAFEKLTGLKLLEGGEERTGRDIGLKQDRRNARILRPDGSSMELRLPEDLHLFKFEVHSLRYAQRVGPDGNRVDQLIFTITQRPQHKDSSMATHFRGGCTLILDLATFELRYSIAKPIWDAARMQAQRQYQFEQLMTSLNATYFGNPFDEHNAGLVFAALHGDF